MKKWLLALSACALCACSCPCSDCEKGCTCGCDKQQCAAQEEPERMLCGGYSNVSAQDEEVLKAAEFAAIEKSFKLVKVLSSRQQVVAGMNYNMTLLVSDEGGDTFKVQAVVWRKVDQTYALTQWDLIK